MIMVKALVCSKCGVIASADNDFLVGFLASHHAHSRTTHKMSIKEVEVGTKIANCAGFALLVAKCSAVELGYMTNEEAFPKLKGENP
jgi:hypothetical protein